MPYRSAVTKRRRSTGQAIGSILAGFDHQVFRATKPPAELVESARPLPAIPGRDGSLLSIALPVDVEDAADDSGAPRGTAASATAQLEPEPGE